MERTVKRVLPLILTLFFTVLAFFGSLFLGNMPGSSAETEVQLYVGLGAAGFGGTSVMTNEKLPDADGITSASKSLKVGMGKKGLDQWAWMDGTNGADASAVSDAVVEVLLRVNLTNEALVQMGVMDASNGADPNQPNVLMTLPVNDSPSGWYYLRFPVGALAKNKLVLCMIDHKQTGFNDSIYIFSAKVYSDPALTAGTMTKCSFGDVQLEAGPTAMEISPAEGSEFKVGSVVKMETYFTPVLIENSGVTFTSSDPSVAYVHNNFVYCAGEGSAVISAVSHYNENVKASYNITVSGVSTANRLEFAEFATSYPEESDFTPFGTGTSYYVESPDGSAVNVDFRFSEPVAISEAGVSSVNELIFEMWVYSAGAPTFGFRACGNAEANFNNQDGFLQVDSSSYTTQLYQFKDFKPYAWNKIAVAARGSFSGTLQNIGTFQLMDAKSDIYVYGLTMRKAVPGEVSVNYGANFVGYENADCRGIFIGEPIEIDATSIIPVGTGIKKTDGVYTLEKSSTSADFQVFAEVDKLATCKGYSYNSNNPDIATVTEDGVVSVIKAGKATLTVTSEDGKAVNTLVINIKEPDVKVTGINILQGDVEMSLGSSVKLSAAVYPSDADDKSVTWAAVSGVTVTADGMVTLTSPEGGVVRAYSSDAEIYDEIKIIPLEPENVKLSMSGGMWGLSGEMVSDSVPGVAGAKPSDESLKWKNGDTQGKFSEGTDISAVVKSGYGVMRVVVYLDKAEASELDIGLITSVGEPGQWEQSGALYRFREAFEADWYEIYFKLSEVSMGNINNVDSSDAALQIVDHHQKIDELRIYSAEIIYDENFAFMGNTPMKMTRVGELVVSTAVAVNGENTSYVNVPVQLTASVTPDNASDKGVIWSVVSGAAYVNDSGLVTFLQAGTVKIKAETLNGLTAEHEITVNDIQNLTVADYNANGITDTFKPEGFTGGETYKLSGGESSWIRFDTIDFTPLGATKYDTVLEFWLYCDSLDVVKSIPFRFFDSTGRFSQVDDLNTQLKKGDTSQSAALLDYKPNVWTKVYIAMRGDWADAGQGDQTGAGANNFNCFSMKSTVDGDIYVYNPRFIKKSDAPAFLSSSQYIALGESREVPVTQIKIRGTVSEESGYKMDKDIKDGNFTVSYTVSEFASDKSLKWTSSKKSVASVTNEGYVRVYGAGSTTITVTSVSNPEISVSFVLNIVKAAESITISGADKAKTGDNITLTAIIMPYDSTDRNVIWSVVSGPATIDEEGNVAFTGEGTVVIKAQVGSLSATHTITVSGDDGGSGEGGGNENNTPGSNTGEENKGLSTGAIIGIAAACVVVVGGGLAAFFLTRKKNA